MTTDFFDRPLTIACICAEASSENDACQQAIVAAIRNRRDSGRFEPTMAGVVVQRYQMSEFNDDRQDNANLERVVNHPDDPMIARAARNYDAVMADPTADPSRGATHFYADTIAAPAWAKFPARETVVEGRVHFWTNVK